VFIHNAADKNQQTTLRCSLEPIVNALIEIPQWMFDAASLCGVRWADTPTVSGEALLELKACAVEQLVQALRLHLAEGLKGGVGWLFALADKQMSAAITFMHDDPAHRWTIQELAECAGMSRSTFALKFKETVGESPMEYLTRWQMLLLGTGWRISAIPFPPLPCRSATNPKAPSSQPSRGSWAVRHGNIAVVGIRLPLHRARGKPPAPIGLRLAAPQSNFVGQCLREVAELSISVFCLAKREPQTVGRPDCETNDHENSQRHDPTPKRGVPD
jgi:Bacterial regulatory helix-turn-helix proteins, AraC family